MGALSVNRKRGFDHFSPNLPNSPVLNDTHFSKKPKISAFGDRITVSSPKVKSRIYYYPEPVNGFKREVHAPCRVTKFGSWGIRNSPKVVEREIYNVGDETGDFFGSRVDFTKRVRARKLPFSKRDVGVIDVDDIEKGDIEFVDVIGNGDEMGTEFVEKIADLEVENKTRAEKIEMETEPDEKEEKEAVLEVEKDLGIESGDKMSWDLVSLNEKRSLLGMPLYKKLWEEADSNNPKLNNLKFQIEYFEKERALQQLLRPVKKPEEEVVLEEMLQEAFVSLSKEEMAVVSRAFSDSNRRKILTTHVSSNIEITGEVIRCLKPKQWLNDEVINVYLELLKEREQRNPKKFLKCHFFNTFFYKKLTSGQNVFDYKSVRRWTTEKKLGYFLKDCEKIFVPIHKPYHWCLAVINKKDKKFQYLDSLGGTDDGVLKALARYYVEEVKDKSKEIIDVSSWKQENVTDLPAQKNGFDCGVFMVKYTDFYSRGLGLLFKQDDMSYFRLRTAKEILRLKAE